MIGEVGCAVARGEGRLRADGGCWRKPDPNAASLRFLIGASDMGVCLWKIEDGGVV